MVSHRLAFGTAQVAIKVKAYRDTVVLGLPDTVSEGGESPHAFVVVVVVAPIPKLS